MSGTEPPADVTGWAEERAAARARRDFARADELRSRAGDAGWDIVDRPDGYDLRPRTTPPAVSVVVDDRAWPGDAERFLGSLSAHPAAGEAEVVTTGGPDFAAARNEALRRATGDVVAFVDASLELTGDVLGPLVAALEDPSVAVVGPFGLATADLREYEERTEGEVVAVQGYCLAARRSDVLAAGGFRAGFAFYRNADIDLSLRLRTLTPEPRRAVALGADRCIRHAHRDWESADPAERDRLSRLNMNRILKQFGDRLDLAVP